MAAPPPKPKALWTAGGSGPDGRVLTFPVGFVNDQPVHDIRVITAAGSLVSLTYRLLQGSVGEQRTVLGTSLSKFTLAMVDHAVGHPEPTWPSGLPIADAPPGPGPYVAPQVIKVPAIHYAKAVFADPTWKFDPPAVSAQYLESDAEIDDELAAILQSELVQKSIAKHTAGGIPLTKPGPVPAAVKPSGLLLKYFQHPDDPAPAGVAPRAGGGLPTRQVRGIDWSALPETDPESGPQTP